MSNPKETQYDRKHKVSETLVATSCYGLVKAFNDLMAQDTGNPADALDISKVLYTQVAYLNGLTIQSRPLGGSTQEWFDDYAPQFDWDNEEYQVKPEESNEEDSPTT